jgi:ABC-2 type transport system ATP-binding protein
MKQKLGIVIAFMNKPNILLLDEPSSGLDPLMQNKLIELVNLHKAQGATILLSSHMFEEVERTCDRVLIIKQGQIVANESIETLKSNRHKRYIISFKNEDVARMFLNNNDAKQLTKTTVSVDLMMSMNDFISALSTYDVVSIDVPNQSLEEIFLQYYGGDLT